MWNRNIGAAIVDCITVSILLVAAIGILVTGYKYANLHNKCNRLIEIVEEISAEKAMLEGLISHTSVVRPDATNQGWIPPKSLEN